VAALWSADHAAPARAATTNAIVQDALSHVGQHGGQCYPFVQDVVEEATGKQIGFAYRDGYFAAGATEVSPANAQAGDILQISNPDDSGNYYPGMHTAIVITNNGDGTYQVVDSNENWDEMVTVHEWAPSPRSGLQLYAYRIGGGLQVSLPAAPDAASGDSARVSTDDGSCLRLRSGASVGSSVVTCLPNGTGVTVEGDAVSADGYTWRKVSTPKGEGWVASEYITVTSQAVAPADSPATDTPAATPTDDTPASTGTGAASAASDAPVTPIDSSGSGAALVETDGFCLNIRTAGALSGTVITCLVNGTQVTITGDGVAADGYTWVPVQTSRGAGFAALEYLQRTS
jgi:uncharacterized protein YraI